MHTLCLLVLWSLLEMANNQIMGNRMVENIITLLKNSTDCIKLQLLSRAMRNSQAWPKAQRNPSEIKRHCYKTRSQSKNIRTDWKGDCWWHVHQSKLLLELFPSLRSVWHECEQEGCRDKACGPTVEQLFVWRSAYAHIASSTWLGTFSGSQSCGESPAGIHLYIES